MSWLGTGLAERPRVLDSLLRSAVHRRVLVVLEQRVLLVGVVAVGSTVIAKTNSFIAVVIAFDMLKRAVRKVQKENAQTPKYRQSMIHSMTMPTGLEPADSHSVFVSTEIILCYGALLRKSRAQKN